MSRGALLPLFALLYLGLVIVFAGTGTARFGPLARVLDDAMLAGFRLAGTLRSHLSVGDEDEKFDGDLL